MTIQETLLRIREEINNFIDNNIFPHLSLAPVYNTNVIMDKNNNSDYKYEFKKNKSLKNTIKDEIGIKTRKKEEIKKWFKDNDYDVNYNIDENLKITVRGNLTISKPTNEFPKYPLTVTGLLDISNPNIEKLPNKLNVGGLRLRNTKVKKLPDNLTVKGILDISYTKIKTLPEKLNVTGIIKADYTPFAERVFNDELEDYEKEIIIKAQNIWLF